MELLFVTNNEEKIKASKNILGKFIDIKPINLNLKEIQGEPLEVALDKAKEAYTILQKPLIVNDCSFVIEALNGFPSVYANYVEKTLGSEGILKLLENESNRNCYYLDILVYIDKYGYQVFKHKTKGTISKESIEGNFYPYDKIFIKEGMDKPVAYYQDKNLNLYENKAYEELLSFLKKRRVSRGITFIDNQVILLHRIRKEGDIYLEYYAIPGGGVEEFETIKDACLREIKEEVSLDVEIEEYLGFESYETGVCYYFLTNYLKGTPILGGEEKERNNKNNFYEIKLINILDIDNLNMYGSSLEMIKKAYNIYKNKKS